MLAAVAKAQPEELPGITRTGGEDEEILVFADNDAVFRDGEAPEVAVNCLALISVEDMNGIITPGTQPTGESGG